MSTISITKLAENKGMEVKDVRRLGRAFGMDRVKVGKVELYNEQQFDTQLEKHTEKMKKRTITAAHLKKMQEGNKKKT